MTTLVVGDVHGCSAELKRLLDQVQPDHTVFVGDLFTKGPDPVGVFSLCREHPAVMGNHEWRLLEVLAGKRPRDAHAHDVIAALDRDAPEWRGWTEALPLFVDVAGWTVVHAGLHPDGRAATTRPMALFMRRYPLSDRDAPFWWEQYRSPQRVIFGHDAMRGLVRVERDGAPLLIGLDTGCVYGGALSGYVIEEDRVVQVPAERVHCPVG